MPSTKLKRAQRALDKQLSSSRPAPPKVGWIRAVRDALGMTGQQLASRLGVTWQSMADLEKSEAAGTITLNSLTKAAAAMETAMNLMLEGVRVAFEVYAGIVVPPGT